MPRWGIAMRIFIDTNVLYDIVSRRKPFAESSLKLLYMQEFGDAELWAAPQSYLDVFYVGCHMKLMPPDALQNALNAYTAKISICATTQQDIQNASSAGWSDMEDALIGISCKKVVADYFITRDKSQQGFKTLGIPVYDPEGFFNMLECDMGITYEDLPW